MAAEAPLFLLYTSGSTAGPKGVVHSCGGYLTYALYSARQVFQLNAQDTVWCTADIGWITGHTYAVYAPLGLGCTTLLFEGIPSYPGPDRYWQVIEKYRVSVFYTAPTVIRVLMRYGNEPADIHDLTSLRTLGTVGEPLSPDAWNWYHRVIGKGRLGVIDTWWQTETGGIMLAPATLAASHRPGCGRPLPGIGMAIVDEQGKAVPAGEHGSLVITTPWPGMLTGVFGNGGEGYGGYFSRYDGWYATGDSAWADDEGNIVVTGRLDDVIKIGGCRIGTAQVEAALLSHQAVTEAAVVAVPHTYKGQAICAYVTVRDTIPQTPELLEELRKLVAAQIGRMALPEVIQYARGLPKTRSGKIMRRVLRKIASEEYDNFGDTSALADPSVISDLIADRRSVARVLK
jgi:acetyl-CoA synthetase